MSRHQSVTEEIKRRPNKRAGVLSVSPELIEKAIGLEQGTFIGGARFDWSENEAVKLKLYGNGLPEVPEGDVIPEVILVDGKLERIDKTNENVLEAMRIRPTPPSTVLCRESQSFRSIERGCDCIEVSAPIQHVTLQKLLFNPILRWLFGWQIVSVFEGNTFLRYEMRPCETVPQKPTPPPQPPPK